jgi:hypothetical protein
MFPLTHFFALLIGFNPTTLEARTKLLESKSKFGACQTSIHPMMILPKRLKAILKHTQDERFDERCNLRVHVGVLSHVMIW